MEKSRPDALRSPAHISIVERLLGAVFRWSVDPTPSGLQHMDDTANHAVIIHSRLAAGVSRQMGDDLFELLI